ncbi:MAG: hypothetical protein AAFR33_08045 [Pseudomonadota bacterium]
MASKLCLFSALCAALAAPAFAETPSFYLDITAGSALIDRGEELAETVIESAIGIEQDIGPGTAFFEIYRISPTGDDDGAFAEEVDFGIGYGFQAGSHDITLGAAYLTFPGEADEHSLELTGEVAFDAPLTPVLFGFYDVDLEDYGLEATAGPSWAVSDWETYALARLGTVQPKEGASWTFYGAEVGAARPLANGVDLSTSLRWEQSDEDLFARDVEEGEITRFTDNGLAFRIGLTFTR